MLIRMYLKLVDQLVKKTDLNTKTTKIKYIILVIQLKKTDYGVNIKGAVADMRHFERSQFSRSLVHKKNLGLI